LGQIKEPQPMLHPQYERSSLKFTQNNRKNYISVYLDFFTLLDGELEDK